MAATVSTVINAATRPILMVLAGLNRCGFGSGVGVDAGGSCEVMSFRLKGWAEVLNGCGTLFRNIVHAYAWWSWGASLDGGVGNVRSPVNWARVLRRASAAP